MIASMRTALSIALAVASTAAIGQDATTDPTGFAAAAEVRTQVAAMGRAMKPGQGFAWQPLVRDGQTIGALEYWKKPGRPAVHPGQAEYAIVVEGRGTLISGGTMADAATTKPELVEGSRIVGGTTRQLAAGDVMLIPAGTPHYFGITGDRLVLLGMKLPASTR